MYKFRRIMVGFFILAFVNSVSINCFAMKSKNKKNKIVSIKSGGRQKANKNIQNMLEEEIKTNDEQNKIINIREEEEEKQNKKVSISEKKNKNKIDDVNGGRGKRQASRNFQNFVQSTLKGKTARNDLEQEEVKGKKGGKDKLGDGSISKAKRKKQIKIEPILKRNNFEQEEEKNFNIGKVEEKFKLVNRKYGSHDMKKIVETIKLNMLKYLATEIFNKNFKYEKLNKRGIYKILKEKGVEDYSDFYIFLLKLKDSCKYSSAIKKVDLKGMDENKKETIRQEIRNYFNILKKNVFGEELIQKLKTTEKNSKKYEKVIKFFVGQTKKYFKADDGQYIKIFIEYIFDELKREKNYSKYFNILKKDDKLLSYTGFGNKNIDDYKNDERKEYMYKKYDGEKLIKINILKALARDLTKSEGKNEDINNILKSCGIKGFKRFDILILKQGKAIRNNCRLKITKEGNELNEQAKNESIEKLKKYFNGMKDKVLGDKLTKNLKKLKKNSDDYNKLKKTIHETIQIYFARDNNFNFDNFFEDFVKEKHSEYLRILKEYDLIDSFYFSKEKKMIKK